MSKLFPLSMTIGAVILSLLPLGLLADEAANKSKPKAEQTGKVAHEARLGIGVAPLPEVLTSHLPEVISDGRGVLVSEVMDGSAADKAGLKKFDVLVRYDDQELYSTEQLVKRVRNDEPGKSVELQYVRAGKLLTVKATLGEQTKKEVIVSKLPGLGAKLQVPWSPIRPEFWTEAHDRAGDGTEWTSFESMSVEKHEDGAYVVRVTYKDTSGNSISKEFKGTRQEIRDAINDDHDLPDSRKQQLTRTLDDRGQSPLMQRDWQNWNRELFNWPNVDF